MTQPADKNAPQPDAATGLEAAVQAAIEEISIGWGIFTQGEMCNSVLSRIQPVFDAAVKEAESRTWERVFQGIEQHCECANHGRLRANGFDGMSEELAAIEQRHKAELAAVYERCAKIGDAANVAGLGLGDQIRAHSLDHAKTFKENK